MCCKKQNIKNGHSILYHQYVLNRLYRAGLIITYDTTAPSMYECIYDGIKVAARSPLTTSGSTHF